MYLKDPKDGNPSVSLTILGVTFLPLLSLTVKFAISDGNIEPLMNLFYTCSALYFGRRLNIGSKTFSSDKDSKSE